MATIQTSIIFIALGLISLGLDQKSYEGQIREGPVTLLVEQLGLLLWYLGGYHPSDHVLVPVMYRHRAA